MRSTNPGRYLIFFLIKFPVEWRQNHVWEPIFDPVMSIFINVTILDIRTASQTYRKAIYKELEFKTEIHSFSNEEAHFLAVVKSSCETIVLFQLAEDW